MRCLYVDLDGTLLGAGGALLCDGEGAFSLLAARALEACSRAGVEVVVVTGRRRDGLREVIRLLGVQSYVFEIGGGLVLDGEVQWLGGEGAFTRIAESGAPALLREHFGLEPHAPWDAGREVSHLLRGDADPAEANALLARHGHDDLRLLDNGHGVHHLVPAGISKAAAVAAHMQARGYGPTTASRSATRARTCRWPSSWAASGWSRTPSRARSRRRAGCPTSGTPRPATGPASTRRS